MHILTNNGARVMLNIKKSKLQVSNAMLPHKKYPISGQHSICLSDSTHFDGPKS
jgi:hypothetical protein